MSAATRIVLLALVLPRLPVAVRIGRVEAARLEAKAIDCE